MQIVNAQLATAVVNGPRARSSRRNLRFGSIILVASIGVVGCGGSSKAYRSCADPALGVGRSETAAKAATTEPADPAVKVAPGTTLNAVGVHFESGCEPASQKPPRPQRSIRLFVVQGQDRISVAQVNATGPDNGFAIAFGVPATLATGSARLVAQASVRADAEPLASVEFRISPST